MNWTGGKKYVMIEVAMEKEKLRNALFPLNTEIKYPATNYQLRLNVG